MKTYKTKSGKIYTKKQICEAIDFWKKQLKKINESESMIEYHVEAKFGNDEIDTDISASSLEELVKFTRETFAQMHGCRDTSTVDVSWIDFKFINVEDENGNNVTKEANEAIN